MKNCGVIFDLDKRNEKIKNLEQQTLADDFWQDNEKAQDILKQHPDFAEHMAKKEK